MTWHLITSCFISNGVQRQNYKNCVTVHILLDPTLSEDLHVFICHASLLDIILYLFSLLLLQQILFSPRHHSAIAPPATPHRTPPTPATPPGTSASRTRSNRPQSTHPNRLQTPSHPVSVAASVTGAACHVYVWVKVQHHYDVWPFHSYKINLNVCQDERIKAVLEPFRGPTALGSFER